MASNANDLLKGKAPYKEIFIQYGLFTTIIHAFFIKISGYKVISIFYGTSFIYSVSMFLFYLLIKKKFEEYFALFGLICLFLIHPFTNHPWHNYITFLFLILSLICLENIGLKGKFVSGFFFSLAVLSYEKFILVFILFFITYFSLNLINKDYKKIFYFLLGFFIPILFFLFYLNQNQILDKWFLFHSISNLYLDSSYILLLFNFIKTIIFTSLTKLSLNHIGYFFYNLIFYFLILKKKKLRKKKNI